MESPLVLVDGSSYFYRAFHALPPLTNSKQQPTGAIYGVANMIKRLIKEYQPKQIAVVFDAKGKTFRDDLYPAYKANREKMPDDLSCQFQPLVELLTAMGLPLLIIEGVEADDVIGTLAEQATKKGMPVLISTGDKDMAQLVNDHVTLINTMSNQRLDIVGVQEKFGVTPSQIIDYLTLVGDVSDNVPGVPKCGPKTAAKWLNIYQTLDNLIQNADKIEGKVGEYLRASIPQLPLCKQLITIKTDLNLPLGLHELDLKPENRDQLITMTQSLEFKSWLKELLGNDSQPTHHMSPEIPAKTEQDIILSASRFDTLLHQLSACDNFCIDLKTTGEDILSTEITGMGLAITIDHPMYIPLAHVDETLQLNREKALLALKPILENSNIKKIGHNLKYAYHVFKNHGIVLRGIAFDTMLESYLLDSSLGRQDLDTIALKYLGHNIHILDVAGTRENQGLFHQNPVRQAAPYALENTNIILKLHHVLYPLMDKPLRSVLHEIEMPLITVLADMERHGVLIDKHTLLKHGERLKIRMSHLEEETIQLAGREFNLNSPKQLQEILYQELQLPVLAKTPTGQPSTAESVLQELAYDYRLPAILLEYRGLNKLVSTYIDALPKRINPSTHRVHTSYNQAVTATGRLSSSEPNLQNIPVRSEEGRLIRKAFIAPDKRVILAADYSQIELRIMAHLSKDPNLLQAFANGWDIHAATASEIFSVDLASVTHEQRRRAKAVNFGLIYGMSSFGLAKQLDVDRQDAQHYIDRYFHRYPGVFEYMENTRKQAHEVGYVETLFGRRLYLPEINVRNIMRRKAAERMAINAPMQGTAADIIKKAMIAVTDCQNAQNPPRFRMIMQVHDELVFEVCEDSIDFAKETIRPLMEHTVELSVPLLVSIGVGHDWDEAH